MSKARKILIIEDNIELVKLLNMQLSQEGFEVFCAEDAVHAITVAQEKTPSVILLDLGLPGGDGFVVMKRLAKLRNTNLIPIIVISGQEKEGNEAEALKAGAVAYLAKPVKIEDVLTEIRKALGEEVEESKEPNHAGTNKA